MESSKIAHIAAEVVLLGGITFYFNGQVKGLRNEIKELKAKIEEQAEANNKHLNNVYSLIDRLSQASVSGRPMPHPHSQQPHANHPTDGLRQRRRPSPEAPRPVPKGGRSSSASSSSPASTAEFASPHRPFSRPAPVQEEPKEEDLDEELGQELRELQEEELPRDEDELKDMDAESNAESKKK